MRMFQAIVAGAACAGVQMCFGQPAFAAAKHPPGESRDAVAYQINSAHSGAIAFSSTFAPPLKRRWVDNLGGPISYPLIEGGLVFVTVGDTNNYGTQLYALDLKTGTTVWQQAISGTYFWSNAAYDRGQVFEVNYDGVLQAFAAGTGALAWSVQLPGQYAFSSPPTARNGQVFVGGAGSGGTLYAVQETNGTVQWTAGVENGDNSSPALGDGGVYVSYPCQYYGFAPANGQPIWHYNGGCDGGGGKTPVYTHKQVYVRDPDSSNVILDAGTGNSLGTFAATPAPAFFADAAGKRYGARLASGTLYGFDPKSQAVLWSFTGDGQLTTAPIAVNGQVIEGSGSGELYVLDGPTGSMLWSTNVGASIPAPDEQNVSQPLTGLGAGDGALIVPAGNQISAYVAKK